jgi:hypothetical protein
MTTVGQQHTGAKPLQNLVGQVEKACRFLHVGRTLGAAGGGERDADAAHGQVDDLDGRSKVGRLCDNRVPQIGPEPLRRQVEACESRRAGSGTARWSARPDALLRSPPIPSNLPKRRNRSIRPPHEGPAFRTCLSQCARRRVRRSPRQPRPPSAQQSLSRDERRKRTNDCAGKKRKMIISRPLPETSGDSRPNSPLKCRPHGASLCRRSYRSTAPSGMGHDTRPSRTPRAPSPGRRMKAEG